MFEYDCLGRLKKKYMPFKVTFDAGVNLSDSGVYAGLESVVLAALAAANPAFEQK